MSRSTTIRVGLSAAILAVTAERPRVLTVAHGSSSFPALPFGPLDPIEDRTLELGLRGWVREQTGLELDYVEQLYTFGDRDRDPIASKDGRVISVAYLALVREEALEVTKAKWRDVYAFLPWEDRREGPSPRWERELLPALEKWVAQAPKRRRARAQIPFGMDHATWDPERVLERYEILWEAGLATRAGEQMALDHRRILATALGRVRAKIRYRPIVFEVMPESFTLLQLQKVVEAMAGARLHKQNFRRLLEKGRLVEGTGVTFSETGGRPAELFRFRRDVLLERPSTGVRIPRRG